MLRRRRSARRRFLVRPALDRRGHRGPLPQEETLSDDERRGAHRGEGEDPERERGEGWGLTRIRTRGLDRANRSGHVATLRATAVADHDPIERRDHDDWG